MGKSSENHEVLCMKTLSCFYNKHSLKFECFLPSTCRIKILRCQFLITKVHLTSSISFMYKNHTIWNQLHDDIRSFTLNFVENVRRYIVVFECSHKLFRISKEDKIKKKFMRCIN